MRPLERGRELVRRRRAADDGSTSSAPPQNLLEAIVDKAVQIPSATIRAHVDRVRARNPEADPARLIGILEREYLRVIQTTGGAVGAAAAVPAVGTGTAALLTSSDVATFFGASAAFSLAVADVHGIEVHDTARRRALLLATVLGEDAVAAFGSGATAAVPWGTLLLTHMPANTVKQVNKILTGRYLKRFMVRKSGLALGRMVPFGVGAVIGVVGARALGRGVIAQSRRAFGLPPVEFGVPVRVVEAGTEPSVRVIEPGGAEPGPGTPR